MKIVIRILLVLLIISFSTGFYLLNIEHPKGKVVVGSSVLVFAFVFLPLFLYNGFKGKKLTDYTLDKDKINQIFDNLNS